MLACSDYGYGAVGCGSTTGESVSVLIITFNEENTIETCLNSVKWSDDIVILDSYSTDKTESIIKRFNNVRFYQRKFDDFSSQKNYGLHNIDLKNDWVFLIDADEICSADLGREIINKTANATGNVTSFVVSRKDYFCGKMMRCHFPVWLERVVRPKEVIFTGIVHESLESCENQQSLKNPILHYPFAKGIHYWFERHNNYSTLMANMHSNNTNAQHFNELLSSNPGKRQKAMKHFFMYLPTMPIIYFLYKYVIKCGFLDGWKGLFFVLMETYYHFMVVIKVKTVEWGRK